VQEALQNEKDSLNYFSFVSSEEMSKEQILTKRSSKSIIKQKQSKKKKS
jgi:hypothetical protein